MTTSKHIELSAERLSELPRLPCDHDGPVFAEPWQAQAFALAVNLSEQGYYTWKEWAAELAAQLKAAADRGEPDDGSRYYEYWLAALERLVVAKGLADPQALAARKDAWISAYRNTPHGRAVELHPRAIQTSWAIAGLALTTMIYAVLQQISRDTGGGTQHVALPSALAASAGFGMMLGMRHALEADHLAAIATLMTGERSSGKAAWLGACWGLGHTVTLLAAGTLLVTLQTEMPRTLMHALQLCAVLLLVGFGVRALYHGARRVMPGPTHTHQRPGVSRWRIDRWTLARPFLVGAVHGLAGSGALIAMVVTTLPSAATRLAYLLLFGAGSTLAMAALSGFLGWPLAQFGANRFFVRAVAVCAGAVSVALGAVWAVPLIGNIFASWR